MMLRAIKLLSFAGLCALLIACAAKPLPLRQVVDVTGPDGVVGGDVYAKLRETSPQPEAKGSQLVEFRAYDAALKKSDEKAELSDVKCHIRGDVYEAEVLTPSAVRIPLYGHLSPQISVDCQKVGYSPKVFAMKPYNHSRAQRRRNVSGSGAGLIGALVVGIASGVYESAINDETTDVFHYPAVAVKLERNGELPPLDTQETPEQTPSGTAPASEEAAASTEANTPQ